MTRIPRRIVTSLLAAAALAACPGKAPAPDVLDTTPPRVLEVRPADGATDVAILSKIVVTFSEDLVADSVKLHVQGGGADVVGALDVDGATATFTPDAPLTEGQSYAVTVAQGYRDAAGNEGAAFESGFGTAQGVLQVAQTDPADGAQNVPVNAPVSARFNQPVDTSSLDETSFYLRDGTHPVAGTISYQQAESVAVFTPAQPLFEGRVYTVTLTSELRDLKGNTLPSAHEWTFGTAATVPTVVGITPHDGAADVAGNAPVQGVFSEAMDPATLTPNAFQVFVQGASVVPGTRSWNAQTRTATFQPAGAYPAGAVIEVRVTPGITDVSGIPLADEVTATFTVSHAPSVAQSAPSPDAVGVAHDAQVALTFSQAMNEATLTADNVWVEDASGVKVSAAYVPGPTSLVMVPAAPFTESEPYTVVVTPAVGSAAGLPFAAEYRFTFTTLGVAPAVVAVLPAPGATDVAVNAAIRVEFNEDMDPATFTDANLRLSDGAADVTGTVSAVDARTVELLPASPLRELAAYTVIVGAGFADARGNALGAEYRSTFHTEPLPRVVSMHPAANAQNVPSGSAVILVANKPLDAATVTLTPPTGLPSNTVTLYEEDGVIEGALTYEPATRSIRLSRLQNGAPAPWTAGKRYLVVVDGSKLQDPSGNAVGGVITHTFVAGASADTTPPAVTSISPLNGETGASRQTQPFVIFDEPLDPTSLSNLNVRLQHGGSDLPGRIEYVSADKKVLFIPEDRLPAGATLSFLVGTGIRDTSGNLRAATNNISFTTSANTEPQLVAVSPANNATNVAVNATLRLVFSEPIAPATLVVTVTDGVDPIPGTLAYDDASASATFTPAAPWAAMATYSYTLEAGLEDLEGAATAQDVVRTFTTVANGSNDITPPEVSATLPQHGAVEVSARPTVQLSFSEPLDPATVTLGAFSIEASGGSKVPFGLAFDAQSDTVTLLPSGALAAGGSYGVKVEGTLKDLAGNAVDPLAASSSLSFTVDGSAPVLTHRSPSPSAIVGTGVGVEVTFSEAMDPRTLDAASFTLSANSSTVLAAVWYEPGARTLFLRPAAKLQGGSYTASLDGARVADLAGNTVADSFSFTVSTSGPSVDAVSPCGQIIDPANFGNTVISVQFDAGVQKTGGGALDGAALKLLAGGTPVTVSVGHVAGAANATLTPGAVLQHDTTYTVQVDASAVQNAATLAPMTSAYACTFRTRKLVFEDTMDPTAAMNWSAPASGQNQWKVANTNEDPGNTTQAWRAGHNSGAGDYTRICDVFGGTAQEVRLERDLNLSGLTEAELRVDTFHKLAPNDSARVQIVIGTQAIHLEAPFTGASQTAYTPRSYDLTPYVNQTVKLRFTLNIAGGTQGLFSSCPATDIGFFVDDILVVGQ